MPKQCSVCRKEAGFFGGLTFQSFAGKEYCGDCGVNFVRQAIDGVIVTTTPDVDGHEIVNYIDVESVEIVVGTGVFSEFGGDVADFFGSRSTGFEQKMQKAKRTAIDKLRFIAATKGGNAVVGIDLDYTEFSNNRVGVIANGTIVELRRRQQRL